MVPHTNRLHCIIYVVSALILLLQWGCSQSEKQTEVSIATKPPVTEPTPPPQPAISQLDQGQQKYTLGVTPPTSGPVMTFEKTVHDFGEINRLSKQICEFHFRNTGGTVLNVQKKINSTCGCTVPVLTKTDYAPGETGVIKVTFSAGSSVGKMQKLITVHSNDSQRALRRLTVKANIIQQIIVTPASLTLSPNNKNAGCVPITLKSRDGMPFAITQIRSSGNAITVPIDPNLKATAHTLEPAADLKKLETRPLGFLLVTTTHPKCKTVNIKFTMLREYQFKPSYLFLTNTEPNKPVTREVWLTNNYDQVFTVEDVSSPRNLVRLLSQETVPTVNKNEFTCRLKLSITPPPVTKGKMFMDVLAVRLDNGKILHLTCRGMQSTQIRPPIRTRAR